MDTLDNNFKNEPQQTPQNDDNSMAMLVHLLGLISLMSSLLGFIATAVFYAVNKKRSHFVREHARQALNFQIGYFLLQLIIASVSIFFLLRTFVMSAGAPDAVAFSAPNFSSMFTSFSAFLSINGVLWLTNLVVCIVGAVKANTGEVWRNPIAIPFIKL